MERHPLAAAAHPHPLTSPPQFSRARFATPADADLLVSYLDTYLPQFDKRYDQDWALGALLHIDAVLGADQTARFLSDGGLWQQWRRTEETPAALRAWIDQLCSIADECMGMA